MAQTMCPASSGPVLVATALFVAQQTGGGPRGEWKARKDHQRVTGTRWWQRWAAWWVESQKSQPMSHRDLLVVYYATKRAAVTRTGPDDAGHVVWAIGNSFPFYFMFFNTTNYCFYSLLRKATRTGPDDAGQVVWAIGKSVSFILCFFNTDYCFYSLLRKIEGGSNGNRPK